jgi:hypothetical protein
MDFNGFSCDGEMTILSSHDFFWNEFASNELEKIE